MSPKSPYDKGLVVSLWPYWEKVGPVKKGVLSGNKLGHWRHDLEGKIGTLSLPFPLFLLPACQEANRTPLPGAPLLCLRPRGNTANCPENETLKL